MIVYDTSSLQIHQYKVGPLRTNSYFLVDPKTDQAFIIDPGEEGDFLSEELLRLQLTPLAFILTHAHFDHLSGLLPLKLNFPNAPVLLSYLDKKIYNSAAQSAYFWQKQIIDPPPPIDQNLANQKELKLNSQKWQIIPTPGHSPGSISLFGPLDSSSQFLFSGDTLFAEGAVGRTDFSYASSSDLKKSLQKIFSLPADTVLLPGHGRLSTLADEIVFHSDLLKK